MWKRTEKQANVFFLLTWYNSEIFLKEWTAIWKLLRQFENLDHLWLHPPIHGRSAVRGSQIIKVHKSLLFFHQVPINYTINPPGQGLWSEQQFLLQAHFCKENPEPLASAHGHLLMISKRSEMHSQCQGFTSNTSLSSGQWLRLVSIHCCGTSITCTWLPTIYNSS